MHDLCYVGLPCNVQAVLFCQFLCSPAPPLLARNKKKEGRTRPLSLIVIIHGCTVYWNKGKRSTLYPLLVIFTLQYSKLQRSTSIIEWQPQKLSLCRPFRFSS